MLRMLILMIAAIGVAALAGWLLPTAAPFLAQTPPAVLGAIAAIATLLVADLSTRTLHDDRTRSQIRRLAAKSTALELELAALRGGVPVPTRAADPQTTPAYDLSRRAPLSIPPPEAATDPRPRPPRDDPNSGPVTGPLKRLGSATKPSVDDDLLALVREALRNDQIALHVQPIVDLADRQTLYYECFSRLRTADGTLLTPRTYLPVVESEGLTAAIDNMLLLRCVQLVKGAQRRDRPVTFFCNISGHSLADRVFFADFLDFASDNALLSGHLVFEIDHRTLATLPPDATRDLRALADLGYRFAVDNADLTAVDAALLTDHRVAFVKTRITDLAEHASSDRHLTDLERPLLLAGADLIATHIERETHAVSLANLPVKFGQGYLFGEPVPIETLRQD